MKQLLYILALLLFSCAKESSEDKIKITYGNIDVQFKVDIPNVKPIATRAINENLIINLQLLIFDENNRFISRHAATLLSGNNYTANIPQSNNKRTIHFIANYDWNSFNDAIAVNKDEGEIIAPLQSTSLTFWQRMVFNNGINASIFTTQYVSLIRNMAKFTLVNNANSGLTNAKFALFNQASAGSVAPFNTINKAFELVVTEPLNVTFTNTNAMGVADIFTFERKNSTVTTNPTYVIIEGIYAGATYYYKIDIIDDNKNMYDIQRNVWFNIVIQSVTMAGYTTIEAAQSSPASNNISASVLLQSYPTISDGSYVLSVDKTIVSFTSNGQILHANATYKTITGVTQNSSIVVTLVQDINFPVVNGAVTYDIATGNITANINNIPPDGVAYFATIKIEAGYLSRTIRLMLHVPFKFTNISLLPIVVNNVLQSPATLKFTVPAESEYLLPFNCYITSAYLTPAFGNIEVIHKNGLYKYKWKVTTVGEQIINFNTNTNNAAETIFIDADLFKRGQIAYTNTNGVYRFSNVVITPNPVNFGIGNAVVLKFTVPTAGTYKIFTSNLTPVSGVAVGGIYTYTATTAGEQIVNFTTNKQSIAETIKLTGVNYIDYTIALKNQLVNILGTLTYSNSNTIINSGTVTVSIGPKVVGIFTTNSTGVYQAYIEANIGDVLTFSYTKNSTYTATQTITSTPMVINKKLL
ncbi:MAG: hypothetical protein RSA75_04825 [Bacteroidales bacterium]